MSPTRFTRTLFNGENNRKMKEKNPIWGFLPLQQPWLTDLTAALAEHVHMHTHVHIYDDISSSLYKKSDAIQNTQTPCLFTCLVMKMLWALKAFSYLKVRTQVWTKVQGVVWLCLIGLVFVSHWNYAGSLENYTWHIHPAAISWVSCVFLHLPFIAL